MQVVSVSCCNALESCETLEYHKYSDAAGEQLCEDSLKFTMRTSETKWLSYLQTNHVIQRYILAQGSAQHMSRISDGANGNPTPISDVLWGAFHMVSDLPRI